MKKHEIMLQNLPKGRLIEIYGDVNVGKTRTVLTLISELQNETCLYIDVDRDLTAEKLLKYGVQDIVTVLQPDTIEQIEDILTKFLEHDAFNFIVIDSTANLISEELRNLPVDQTFGRKRTRAIFAMIQRLVPIIEQKDVTVIFISQTRQNPDGTFYATGGKALRFFASVRFLITEDDIISVKNKTERTLLKTP